MHEWPLLIFTLLLQGAVGLTLFLSLACGGEKFAPCTARRMWVPVFSACVLAGVGLLASVFHLGYPLNAFNALRHISSSWLSREILFASLFLACLGVSFLALLFKLKVLKGLLPIAVLLGLIDVFCMSEIYMRTSVVTWTHFNTLVMFYGSVAIVGGVMFSVVGGAHNSGLLRWAAGAIVVAVLVRLLTQIPYMTWLSDVGLNDALTFPHQPLTAFRALADCRLAGWILSVIGAVIFVCGAVRAQRGWLFIGGVMLLVAEVLLRFVFFSIH